MTNLIKSTVLAVAVMGIFSASAESASAANRFAVTRVENPFSNITITYSFRWGNGPWQQATLYPGRTRWHAWHYKYADQNRSPKLYIRFDSDRTNSGKFMQNYWLISYAVPDRQARGKVYRFTFDGPARKFIDLRAIN